MKSTLPIHIMTSTRMGVLCNPLFTRLSVSSPGPVDRGRSGGRRPGRSGLGNHDHRDRQGVRLLSCGSMVRWRGLFIMHVCICICIYICCTYNHEWMDGLMGLWIYLPMDLRIYALLHLCFYTSMHLCRYAGMQVRTYACTHVRMYATCPCVHVCMCACMYLSCIQNVCVYTVHISYNHIWVYILYIYTIYAYISFSSAMEFRHKNCANHPSD
jgi:hypothetical protein